MKFGYSCKSFMVAVVMLLASSAFAQSKRSVELSRPVMLNGTELKPGGYNIRWAGTGPDVEVSLRRGRKVLATMPARLSTMENASAYDAVVTRQNGTDVNTLAGFRFRGKTMAIDLGQSNQEVQAASAK
jgi:hypothetical protein